MTTDVSKHSLAVIPARGGSKRVPGKNLRQLAGRPILAYTIDAALESAVFDQVVVSTDDPDIAAIASELGASVPFVRGAALADDHTPVSKVTLDVLDRLDADGGRYPIVCQLMANCPLRDASDIKASCERFLASGAAAQISTSAYGLFTPWWAMRVDDTGVLTPLFSEVGDTRSQDLPRLVCPNGAIWWAKSEALRASGTFHIPSRTGFEMPWLHALDIDTPDDWALAETLLSASPRT